MIDPRVEELLEQAYLWQVENTPQEGDFPAEVVRAAADLGYIAAAQAAPSGTPPLGTSPWPLTPAGREAARNVVRRHRLAECLLVDVLAVSKDQMEQDACRFEHILREGLDEKVCALLGHPAQCPHGKDIPPGDCCREAKGPIREVSPLSEGKVHDEGAVAYLNTRDERDVQKLMALGVLPGVHIRLLRRFPSFVFQVAYSQFTVDRELADKITVRWDESGTSKP